MQRSFTTAALAALSIFALAGAARAEDQHILAGDLSQPAGVASFHHQLAKATDALCGDRFENMFHKDRYQACVEGVRDEAVAQLPTESRQELAAAEAAQPMRLAKAGQ